MHDDCERTSNLKMVVQLNPRLGMFSQYGVQISLHLSKQKCFWKTEKWLGINLRGWKDVDAEPKTATKYGKAIGARFYFWPYWSLWPPMYLARGGRSWSSNRSQSDCPVHSHTDLLGLGIIIALPLSLMELQSRGGKVSGHRFGGAFSRFCNFGFRLSAWITTLCVIWWRFHRRAASPKKVKKRDEGWNYFKLYTQGTNLINISTSKFVKHSHKRILRQDILHFHTTALLWLYPLSPADASNWSRASSDDRTRDPHLARPSRWRASSPSMFSRGLRLFLFGFHNSLKSFPRRSLRGCNWEQMRRPLRASVVMSALVEGEAWRDGVGGGREGVVVVVVVRWVSERRVDSLQVYRWEDVACNTELTCIKCGEIIYYKKIPFKTSEGKR